MAWIPMHDTLPDHPKLRRLARSLGVEPPMAIGYLACLWLWALKYGKSGCLSRADDIDVAVGAGWTGSPERFVAVMIDEGWIDKTEQGLMIHDWQEFGGRYERERNRNDDKMKRLRGHDNDAGEKRVLPAQHGNVPVTSPVRTGNEAGTYQKCNAIRGEERREEESITPKPPLEEKPPKKKTKGELIADPLLLERLKLRQAFRNSGILSGDADKMTAALSLIAAEGRLDEVVADAPAIVAWFGRQDADERRMWTLGRILHEYDALKGQMARGSPPSQTLAPRIPHAY